MGSHSLEHPGPVPAPAEAGQGCSSPGRRPALLRSPLGHGLWDLETGACSLLVHGPAGPGGCHCSLALEAF